MIHLSFVRHMNRNLATLPSNAHLWIALVLGLGVGSQGVRCHLPSAQLTRTFQYLLFVKDWLHCNLVSLSFCTLGSLHHCGKRCKKVGSQPKSGQGTRVHAFFLSCDFGDLLLVESAPAVLCCGRARKTVCAGGAHFIVGKGA